jgi:hypothetical protein
MTKIKKPTNTALQAGSPAMNLLQNTMPGGEARIERQEKEGQREFVASDTLPTMIRHHTAYPSDEERQENLHMLREMGIEVGDPFKDDELFMPARLPKGWKKCSTTHPMYSHIVDDKGRLRIEVFYKAAYYDRRANATLIDRVGVRIDDETSSQIAAAYVYAKMPNEEEHIIARFEETVAPYEKGNIWKIQDKLEERAQTWLDNHYPDHANNTTYWELSFDEPTLINPETA